MELTDAIRARRMVRSFSGRPVAAEALDRILAAAALSPTAGNTEGWALVVLQGAGTEPFWAATTSEPWRQRARRWPGLSRAPVVVTVFTNPDRYRQRYGRPDKQASGLATAEWPTPFWYVDAGQVVMTLLLAAIDEDLGAGFLGNFRGEERLTTALGVPGGWHYVGAVLMGEPGGDDPRSASLADRWRRRGTAVHMGRW